MQDNKRAIVPLVYRGIHALHTTDLCNDTSYTP